MTKISKKAVKKLASGSVKENKGKYSVMIFSIILTTVLFSFVYNSRKPSKRIQPVIHGTV